MKRTYILLLIISIFLFTACSNKQEVSQNIDNRSNKVLQGLEVFKNRNARLAVAHAIEKDYIENIVLGDGSIKADYIIPLGLSFDENGKDFREQKKDGYYHYDVDKALEYWNKAKEEVGFDKCKVSFLTYDDESRRKVCEYVQAQLMRNLPGIEITINVQPFKNKVDMAKQGDFDLDIGGWGSSYPDPQTFLELFYNDYSLNFGKYRNDEYSKIIDDIKFGELATKPKERFEAMNKAEKILLYDDVAIAPLVQVGASFLVKPEIQNFKIIPAYQGEYMFKFITQNHLTNEKAIIRTIGTLDLPTVDPTMSNATQSSTVLANIMEGLTQIAEDGTVIMAGADSYEVSDDGLKYVFHIRDDAKWQNGEPVTAYDYEFAFKRLANPDTGSDMSTLVGTAGIKNAKEVVAGNMSVDKLGVRSIDDKHFEVELDVPVAFFLRLMAKPTFSPINEDFFNAHKDKYATTVEDTLSNGAYKMKTWEYGYGYSIEKNENYWDKENVKNDGASFRILKDSSSAVNLYETGEVDIIPITGEFVESYKENPELMQVLKARTIWIHFNFKE